MAGNLRGHVARLRVVAEHRAPTVDRHDRAVHVARGVGQQVGDHGRDLLRASDASERMQPAQLVHDAGAVRRERVVALRRDRPERDGVRPDAASPIVDGERAGEPFDRGLGGRVREGAGHRPLRLMGRDVDDRAGRPSGEEAAHRGRAAGDGEPEVARDQIEHVCGRGGVERGVAEHRRVVDPAGQRTGRLGGVGGPRGDGLVARIPGHGRRPGPSRGPARRLQVEDDDVAVAGEALGDRPADAAPAARDHVGPRHAPNDRAALYGAAASRQAAPMTPLRIWLVGFGTVGQWLARALDVHADRLAHRYGVRVSVVGLANARHGFVAREDGLDLATALDLAAGRRSIAELPGVRAWPTAIEGLRATEADVLVEVIASPPGDGEPGSAHMREALGRGIPVVTSDKWPVALHGVELAELAHHRGVAFRAESCVMSGTPLLSSLVDGLAGAVPVGLRGLLNATANFILTRMAEGRSYEEALAEAQAAGLAERDPAADVEGGDTVAKVMILAALVFGRQLRREQVDCRGITDVARSELERAAAAGARIKHVATLEFS